jgi:sulfide:quinone oxidoreductase
MKHVSVLVIGGGSAGITVASRLRRKGVTGIAILDPATDHWYQPLWTLVGGGIEPAEKSRRSMSSVIPSGVEWIREAASAIDPNQKSVTTSHGRSLSYDWLVVAPGIQLDWGKIGGLTETLGKNGVASNYRVDLAEQMWQNIKSLTSGTALFTMPAGPIKCAGAPQKIAYLACDHWKRTGVLDQISVHLVIPTPKMFGIPEISSTLDSVVRRYGIHVHHSSEVVTVDGPARVATIRDNATNQTSELRFDIAHVVPPQSAPDWIKASPLADQGNPAKYVKVDKHTLQHPDFPNIFALGDCTTTPNSKTGAAVRKQAPVLVQNLLNAMRNQQPSQSYDGYASCPIVTSNHTCVMAEFNYDLKLQPSFPVIDQTKERRDMFVVKRWLLPLMYWNFMLKGRA